MRVALCTPFSPEIGGGSAQLRSHLHELHDLDVHWYYLAAKPAAAPEEKWKWLRDRLSFRELIGDLSARTGFLPGSKSPVRQVVEQIEADLYWIVGHYEGIPIAAELCDQGRPVHLTIHDDPFGTWKRSGRYRFFQPLLRRTFPDLLRRAKGIDVTSWGMRNLYREKYGVKCFSVYLHVAALPKFDIAPDPGKLTIGHIGTLYHPEPFRRFISACSKVADDQKRMLRIIRIGGSPEMDGIAAQNPELFESYGDVTEELAIPLLASCDLLYAMYPAGREYELFRRTSLPVKLSSYVQAQRPIFAHTPSDSTLACVVNKYKVGRTCHSDHPQQNIARDIRHLLEQPVFLENFDQVRKELMEPWQLQKLRAALHGESWQHFPEFDCRIEDPTE